MIIVSHARDIRFTDEQFLSGFHGLLIFNSSILNVRL